MADLKISELTNLTAADPVSDMLPIVDVSATPPASGSTKRISINNLLSSSPTASGALTVTGLVTAGSATITGALTVDTTTLVVNAAGYADRVGIGTATPAYLVDVLAAGASTVNDSFNIARFTGASAVANDLSLVGPATSQVRLNFSHPTASGNGEVGYDHATNSLRFVTAGTQKGAFNATGAFVLAGGEITANGTGVNFPATQAASSDANCLDDYEEGTWVPTDVSGAGLTFTVTACRYTKVGRAVTIQGNITYPATASTANATWGGFPFNSSDVFNLSINYSDASVATLTYISSNGSNAFLLTPGLNTQNVTVSGKSIGFSGTYMI